MLLNVLKGLVKRRGAASETAPAPTVASLLEQGLRSQNDGDIQGAEQWFRSVLARAPGHADAAHLLGVLLYRTGRMPEAVTMLELAAGEAGAQAVVHLHLARAYQGAGRAGEAESSYLEALRLAPDLVPAHASLGVLYKQLGRLDEARSAFSRGLELEPGSAELWHNLGNLQRDFGQEDEAVSSFDRALALDPGLLEARYSRALALLGSGNLAAGWTEHEVRLQLDRRSADLRPFAQPVWRGEPLEGRTLLVWGEQGVGDEMFHAGMYPELIAAGAQCVFECSAKLLPLFARSFPGARVVPRTAPAHDATSRGVDFQIAAGSLGRYLRAGLSQFPGRNTYLKADPDRVVHWRRRLAALGPGVKAGFCWRSGDVTGERALACTRLDQWGALFDLPGIEWICLQYSECEAELAAARSRFGVRLHRFDVDYFNDLDEVSALTSALDLVVSAPTAVSVHAAALGIEVHQLTYGADWQTHGTGGVPWYPTMTRCLRAWDETWESVLARVACRIRQRNEEMPR